MQFVHQTRPRRKIDVSGKEDFRRYPHGLQFYTSPPTDNISLQEFGDYAVERLKVLKAVETAGIKHVKNTDKYKESLEQELKKLRDQGIFKTLLKRVTGLEKLNAEEQKNIYEDRKKDHVSHFILRLAYCKSEELRRWFVQQELDLFRFRFARETNESIDQFLKFNNLDYKPIPDAEKKDIQDKLTASARESAFNVEYEKYYKVSFLEALDLVSSRRVYISKGFAYVPHSELVVLILTQYRMHLSKSLAVTGRVVPQLDEEDRLLPLLSGLSKQYLGQDYTTKKSTSGQVTADMVDALSKKSYPLCMLQVHQALRQTHHLRHVGRMQYGLFLKAIGLSLDEAMKFWRTEFTKIVDPDKFDKTYSYNIRHNYGKEGKRADYTPYSCIKIIMSNTPGPGDHHGCPFRHTDADLLRQKLQNMHLGSQNVDAIMSEVNRGAYQIACGKYFSATHNNEDFTPNHPNQYYDESQAVLNGKTSSNPASQDTPRRVIRAPVGSNKKPQKKAEKGQDDFIDDDELALAMSGFEETQSQS